MRAEEEALALAASLEAVSEHPLAQAVVERAKADGANTVRLMTNTLASWKLYEKHGFIRTLEKPFPDGSGNKTLIYEYQVNH